MRRSVRFRSTYRWLPLPTVGYRWLPRRPNGQSGSRHCDWSPVVVSIGDVWCRLVTFGDVGSRWGHWDGLGRLRWSGRVLPIDRWGIGGVEKTRHNVTISIKTGDLQLLTRHKGVTNPSPAF